MNDERPNAVTTDKALAVITLCGLVAFLAVLVYFVQEVDLTIVIVVGIAMAAYDFYRTLRRP